MLRLVNVSSPAARAFDRLGGLRGGPPLSRRPLNLRVTSDVSLGPWISFFLRRCCSSAGAVLLLMWSIVLAAISAALGAASERDGDEEASAAASFSQ